MLSEIRRQKHENKPKRSPTWHFSNQGFEDEIDQRHKDNPDGNQREIPANGNRPEHVSEEGEESNSEPVRRVAVGRTQSVAVPVNSFMQQINDNQDNLNIYRI